MAAFFSVGICAKDASLTSRTNTYLDLTAPITEKTVIFPGDPVFSKKSISSIGGDSYFNLAEISLGNHTGTHIDFPAHVKSGGKVSSDYSIDNLIGDGIIIEIPADAISITRSFIMEQPILKDDVVFFKTKNSFLSKQDKFTEQYVYIEPDAAQALLEKKVKMVGIDYISVDRLSAENLPVHKILLSNDILIVENLELAKASAGRAKFFVMPLKVPQMDGLPTRVVMAR